MFSPRLLVVDTSIWGTSLLGLAIRHVICGFYLFIYFSSCLCCPPRFQNSPQTRRWEGFLVFGNFSFKTPFPEWISVPNSFVSLFIFYLLYYPLLKTMGCFSGCLMSSASVQKLFCGIRSVFKCSFDEFVWEKVVSPSHSSTILGPPPLFFVGQMLTYVYLSIGRVSAPQLSSLPRWILSLTTRLSLYLWQHTHDQKEPSSLYPY